MWLHFIPGIVMRTDNEPFKVSLLLFSILNLIAGIDAIQMIIVHNFSV